MSHYAQQSKRRIRIKNLRPGALFAVSNGLDACEAVQEMVERMIDQAIRKERTRIAEILRTYQVERTMAYRYDALVPCSVDPSIEELLSSLADTLDS